MALAELPCFANHPGVYSEEGDQIGHSTEERLTGGGRAARRPPAPASRGRRHARRGP